MESLAYSMCFHVTPRQREDDSVFNNTCFGVLNREKPRGREGAFLTAPEGQSPYWLLYERNPTIPFMTFPFNQVNTALTDVSN